ncbi:EamA family transporter [Brevibacillus dissolubilis]|uniref:EamA family transporter n=1 Tax=Brevibacillus dissolubilis TaxID=1844116 RepID=UPI0011178C5C|nr:EamA family transporter [Brevibacillus dissolubilis]
MRYILLVFLGACSYGVLSTFVKFAYEDGYIVNEVSGSQMFLGAVMAWILVLLLARQKASFKQWLLLAAVGTNMGLTGIFYYAALQSIPASIGIVLLFQFTWIGVLLDAVHKRQWPSRDKLLALVLLFAGTFLAGGLLDGGGGDTWEFTFTGIGLGLLSAVTYALFILFSEKVAVEVHPLLRGAIMTTGSMLITFIVFPPTFLTNGTLFDGTLFQWGFLLAFFGAIIPTLFFTIGVPRIGGDLATILGAAELPTAVLLSSFVLHEHVSLLQWIGVIVILVGIVIPQLNQQRKNRQKRTDPA